MLIAWAGFRLVAQEDSEFQQPRVRAENARIAAGVRVQAGRGHAFVHPKLRHVAGCVGEGPPGNAAAFGEGRATLDGGRFGGRVRAQARGGLRSDNARIHPLSTYRVALL